MSNISIMNLPNGFKIRRKADISRFLDECMMKNSEYYLMIPNEELEITFVKDLDGNVSILERAYSFEWYDPKLEILSTKNTTDKSMICDYIWKYRKHINARWFNE